MVNFGNMSIADLRLGASQVKAAYFGSKQIWGGEEPEIAAVCFTAEQANSEVWFKSGGQTRYFETSTDGQNWSTYTLDTHISLPNVGDKVYFRAATGQTNTLVGISWIGGTAFAGSGKLAGSGDVKYLISQDGDTSQVAKHCFEGAFKNMTSLVTAPKLGLTALTESCYANMFDGCTSLIAAPDIPATILDYHSCINTFTGCRSLTTAPTTLPATTLATWCYDGMFSNCSSLSAAPALPATTLIEGCYKNMFNGCSSLTAAPALPATTIASNCYEGMFQNCTSLTAAPALPAETLASNCYLNMFSGCSNIASIDVSFSAWNPTNATTNWVTNVASSGTFTCPEELSDTRGDSNIPTGWTVVKPAEYIEANSQQYLDTGYAAMVGDEIEITWANTDNTKENKGFLVGSYWSGGGRVGDGQIRPWIFPGITGGGFSTPGNFYTNTMTIGEKFTDNMGIQTSNGKSTYTMYRHSTDTLYSYNEFISSPFSNNLTLCGVYGDASSMANKRIYGWKHWRNGVLIRDMVPINYNGVGAMYDNVSQTVFTSGSGVDFLLPNAS